MSLMIFNIVMDCIIQMLRLTDQAAEQVSVLFYVDDGVFSINNAAALP
jgi:hypothetical protein